MSVRRFHQLVGVSSSAALRCTGDERQQAHTCIFHHQIWATGMLVEIFRNIVNETVNNHPAVFWGTVLRYISQRIGFHPFVYPFKWRYDLWHGRTCRGEWILGGNSTNLNGKFGYWGTIYRMRMSSLTWTDFRSFADHIKLTSSWRILKRLWSHIWIFENLYW